MGQKPGSYEDLDKGTLARSAYLNQDPNESVKVHDNKGATEQHQREGGEYIKSLIFGGMDGIITTFAVVAGSAGADLGAPVVLIMGFSNLIADGLSMGLGDFISDTAEQKYIFRELEREIWEFDTHPEGEKAEVVELLENKGYSNADATRLVELLSKNKEFFINTMMVEELGLLPPDPDDSPAKHGLVTFLSFLVNGLVPLLPFVIAAIITSISGNPIEFDILFWITCFITAVTMFGLGALSSKFSIDPWWKAGCFTLVNGVAAAGASYFIGWAVHKIIQSMHIPN